MSLKLCLPIPIMVILMSGTVFGLTIGDGTEFRPTNGAGYYIVDGDYSDVDRIDVYADNVTFKFTTRTYVNTETTTLLSNCLSGCSLPSISTNKTIEFSDSAAGGGEVDDLEAEDGQVPEDTDEKEEQGGSILIWGIIIAMVILFLGLLYISILQ